MQAAAQTFGTQPILFDWPGTNSPKDRHEAANKLADFIRTTIPQCVRLLGFSHGGNIASEAAALLTSPTDPTVELLVTIATPVTGNYRSGSARRHIHLYSPHDRMQILGGEGPFGIPIIASREFPGATNIPIHGIESSDITGSHGNILWSDLTWAALAAHLNS
jgi:hypothetical protein